MVTQSHTNVAYGGSWADDDIDLSSISVPIERSRHQPHHEVFGSSTRGSRGGPDDPGPPYIIKLLQLPVACDNPFVEDLFQSRYTPYVKFKILVDPASDPLHSGIVRKVAFVELQSYQDYSKALKWHDLYYRQGRRVVVEMADFQDFQHSIKFNEQHHLQLVEIEKDAASGKFRQSSGPSATGTRNSAFVSHSDMGPKLGSHTGAGSGAEASKAGFETVLSKPKPKPNPFGAAKPVDVLAKEEEFQKKLITVNNTTIRTIGSGDSPAPRERRKSMNILKRETKTEIPAQPPTASEEKQTPKYSPASTVSVYGDGKSGVSLAQLLSNTNTDSNLAANSAKSSPKPPVSKPTILKKKNTSSPVVQAQHLSKTTSNGPSIKDLDTSIPKSTPKPDNGKGAAEKGTESSVKETVEAKSADEPKFPPKEDKPEKAEPKPISKPTAKTGEKSNDRPDFKHMFEEMTQKYVPKERTNRTKTRNRGDKFNGKAGHDNNGKHEPHFPGESKQADRRDSKSSARGPRRNSSNRDHRKKDTPIEKKTRSTSEVESDPKEKRERKPVRKQRINDSAAKQETKIEQSGGETQRAPKKKEDRRSPSAPRKSTADLSKPTSSTDKTGDDSNEQKPMEKLTRGSTNSSRGRGNRRRGRGTANLHYVRNKLLSNEKPQVLDPVQ